MSDNCEESERVEAFHDGEMSAAGASRFEMHLRNCAACRAELRELRSLSSLIGSAKPAQFTAAEISADLAAIRRRVDQQPDPLVLRFAARLAGVAAVILIACTARLAMVEGATPPVAAWEMTAITPRATDDTAGQTAALEKWIADDLSRSASRSSAQGSGK